MYINLKIIYVTCSWKNAHPWEAKRKHIVMEIPVAYLYFYCITYPLISKENKINCELFIYIWMFWNHSTNYLPDIQRNMMSITLLFSIGVKLISQHLPAVPEHSFNFFSFQIRKLGSVKCVLYNKEEIKF